MSSIQELQPKSFKVKIQGSEYDCKPMRMSHRLILGRIQPLFEQMANAAGEKPIDLSAAEILNYENELDVLLSSLIPELSDITLGMEDIGSILEQIMDTILPDDQKELKEAKIEVTDTLKADKTI